MMDLKTGKSKYKCSFCKEKDAFIILKGSYGSEVFDSLVNGFMYICDDCFKKIEVKEK
jgi:hypothetical protein